LKPLGPKGALILISVILLLGLSMMGGIGWSLYRGIEPWLWQRLECRIESSSVEATDDGYRLVVAYSYRLDGVTHRSGELSPWYTGSDDYRAAEALREAFSPGSTTRCYVNPDEPREAALSGGVEWPLLAVALLPLVFIVAGVIGLRQWWRERTGRRAPPAKTGLWQPLLFFAFFLIPGVLYLVLNVLIPLMQMTAARGWEETSCTIISSRTVFKGLDMTGWPDYGVDILYRYRYGGREYRSNRYDLLSAVSGDTAFLDKIVAEHPAGAQKRCYVDPEHPEEAVIYRGFYRQLLLFGLFPLPFILFGLWGYYRTFRWWLGRSPRRPGG